MYETARFGFVKSELDAHTLGMNHAAGLLEECGFTVCVARADIVRAIDRISDESHFQVFKNWVIRNSLSHIGFSYRLDPGQALETFALLIRRIEGDAQLSPDIGGAVRKIYFAGLPESCGLVEKEFGKKVTTFRGDESPKETLLKLGLPEHIIPLYLQEQSVYDELRNSFGKTIIGQEKQFLIRPSRRYDYPGYGTSQDNLIKRLAAAKSTNQLPLTRVHAGPYLKDREEALALFSGWLKKLAKEDFLDIISVGSSQLSQSHFGKDWTGLSNGGGVPVNSELELHAIREDASPMLVRAYSATDNIVNVARILEKNLNMAWHALSIWWFNRMDGRGPLGLRNSIREHIDAIRYVAQIGKPFEPNTPHHFAFRGSDDITYVASACLAAKIAKKEGIRYLVLQNMLNTPKSTSGLRDLVKSRAMLRLIRRLEDRNFRVIYQPRAGLDYFSPDIEKAKVQLAAVSALMADVEPGSIGSPEIIHVVSHSEALFLADPDLINESIRITKAALRFYPEFRRANAIEELTLGKEVAAKTEELMEETTLLLNDMEKWVKNLYSAEGLYTVFRMGYLPVPFLWECREEFENAVKWTTKLIQGGNYLVGETGRKLSVQNRLHRIREMNPTKA